MNAIPNMIIIQNKSANLASRKHTEGWLDVSFPPNSGDFAPFPCNFNESQHKIWETAEQLTPLLENFHSCNLHMNFPPLVRADKRLI